MIGTWGGYGKERLLLKKPRQSVVERDASRQSCRTGKVSFKTRKRALHMASIARKYPGPDAEFKTEPVPYKCRYCKQWHTGRRWK